VTDLPIACTLSPGERLARGDDLLIGLVREAAERRPVENGYRFVFAADDAVIRRIAETIIAERRCCQFLRFEAAFDPANGPVAVTVTGPAGTREFLDGLLTS
jgi:hypothetical protein